MGVLFFFMFSCTTQLTLSELRITSKLPWQSYFGLATRDINIFEELLNVKYQSDFQGFEILAHFMGQNVASKNFEVFSGCVIKIFNGHFLPPLDWETSFWWINMCFLVHWKL